VEVETFVLMAAGCLLMMGLIEVFVIPALAKKIKVKNEDHKETIEKNY
jgi:NhaP-type Na+/H+ or K+/H+ antiporter